MQHRPAYTLRKIAPRLLLSFILFPVSLMVFILGASSLSTLIKNKHREIPDNFKRQIKTRSIAVTGLTFNRVCQPNQKAKQYITTAKAEMIQWHDCITNSVSIHPRKPKSKPYPVANLVQDLLKEKEKISTIVYLQTNFSLNILNNLKTSKILCIQVRKHLLTKGPFKTTSSWLTSPTANRK